MKVKMAIEEELLKQYDVNPERRELK